MVLETLTVIPASKEVERAELHKTIWRIANDLRGSVDGWDFKSHVVGMLLYRFISEILAAYLNEQEGAVGKPNVRLRHPQGSGVNGQLRAVLLPPRKCL